MGLDMSYRAIPGDCRLFKIAAGDPDGGLTLAYSEFKQNSAEGLRPYNVIGEFLSYLTEPQTSGDDGPGNENRDIDIGRRWDKLLYLLSEKRRDPDTPYDPKDLMYRAINGGEKIDENIAMPQGVPVTFLTPAEVRKISEILGKISFDSLEAHWDPLKMWEAGVYKVRQDADGSDLTWLREEFEKLADFYQSAAMFGEGVLVFCD